MTDIIRSLYYMVDEWADRQEREDGGAKELLARQEALRERIIHRLGEGGRDMVEALSDLDLALETIHDQALFRAAVSLGARLVQAGPDVSRETSV